MTEEQNDIVKALRRAIDNLANVTATFTCGCTALVLLVADYKAYIANLGDCRAVLSRGGQAVALTVDHTPKLPEEVVRIRELGGYVVSCRKFPCHPRAPCSRNCRSDRRPSEWCPWRESLSWRLLHASVHQSARRHLRGAPTGLRRVYYTWLRWRLGRLFQPASGGYCSVRSLVRPLPGWLD
jgi:hypothetical protein